MHWARRVTHGIVVVRVFGDFDLDAHRCCLKDTAQKAMLYASSATTHRLTHWSQKGKASSRSLPTPERVFFWVTVTGRAMAPWRRPVPLPPHPCFTRYACPSMGMAARKLWTAQRLRGSERIVRRRTVLRRRLTCTQNLAPILLWLNRDVDASTTIGEFIYYFLLQSLSLRCVLAHS